jgi:ribonuclease-3
MSGEARRRRMRALLRAAGVKAGAFDVLERAFVHDSFARESGEASNQRLEFLGDSILGFIAAAWLYERYPDEPEGMLTLRKARIVNDAELARTARRLKLSEALMLGAGMRNAGGTDNASILAAAFEAVVAALYEEFGLRAARRFVEREHILLLDHDARSLLDAKTRLQHLAQARLGGTPAYHDESSGPPHEPTFTSYVDVGGETLGSGSGSSKQIAQQAAAERALEALVEDEKT